MRHCRNTKNFVCLDSFKLPKIMAPNNKRVETFKSKRSASENKKRQQIRHRQTKRYFGCGICQADHRLTDCNKFNKMNLAEKYKTAVKLHYCVNCLARNHLIGKCTSKIRCQKCGGKHHSTLHGPDRIVKGLMSEKSKQPNIPIPAPQRSLTTTPTTAVTAIHPPTSLQRILVPTAQIYALTDDGSISLRAILNPSSTSSHISHSLVSKRKLDTFMLDERKYVKMTITPNMSSTTKYELYLLVVRDLPKNPYSSPIKESIKEKFENLALADPNFNSDTKVDIELGGDLYSRILKSNIIHIDGASLLAQDSSLGWLIMGSYSG